jgi:hypothetical protein
MDFSPEADFYCPIAYEQLTIFTEDAVDDLARNGPDRLLDEMFELFRAQLFASDPTSSEGIGHGIPTVEKISDAVFREAGGL